MKTVYKFELRFVEEQTIELYQDYYCLGVAEQDGTLCLWALVDTETPRVHMKIRIFGTGHPFQEGDNEYLIHLGSVVMRNGFVWHAFQVLDTEGYDA